MERPRMIGGTKEVVWTREAKAAGSGGVAILKCVIQTDGSVTGCRFIKSVAFMDQAILAMVAGWKYTPVMFQGRPVAVDYTFTIPLRSAD
jgi:protein TonB